MWSFVFWILSASFLWQNNIPLYGHHSKCTHSSGDVMSSAMNPFLVGALCEHVFFVSLGYILKGGTVRHMVMVNFWRTCQMVFQVAAPFCIPTSRVRECQALHNLVSTCNCPVFLSRKFWNNFGSK